jgi:phosphate-selective porin OprO and OprP
MTLPIDDSLRRTRSLGGLVVSEVNATKTGIGSSLALTTTGSGENRPYLPARAAFGNPAPTRPLFFADGGFSAFELAGRYSVIDLNDHVTLGIAQSVTGGVFGGCQEIATIGLNWYPNANIRFMLDYYFDTINRLDATGRVQVGQHFQALALRTQAAF